jgi:hypothetical protein
MYEIRLKYLNTLAYEFKFDFRTDLVHTSSLVINITLILALLMPSLVRFRCVLNFRFFYFN